jgi:hypothetical protein
MAGWTFGRRISTRQKRLRAALVGLLSAALAATMAATTRESRSVDEVIAATETGLMADPVPAGGLIFYLAHEASAGVTRLKFAVDRDRVDKITLGGVPTAIDPGQTFVVDQTNPRGGPAFHVSFTPAVGVTTLPDDRLRASSCPIKSRKVAVNSPIS